mmetsp:Transcript_5297/g.14601  ORF Transcript_5297/g.14601 Transcript_5297/m.14601 type:complete len:180 (-) Transcript_5297:664-1203(-)
MEFSRPQPPSFTSEGNPRTPHHDHTPSFGSHKPVPSCISLADPLTALTNKMQTPIISECAKQAAPTQYLYGCVSVHPSIHPVCLRASSLRASIATGHVNSATPTIPNSRSEKWACLPACLPKPMKNGQILLHYCTGCIGRSLFLSVCVSVCVYAMGRCPSSVTPFQLFLSFRLCITPSP